MNNLAAGMKRLREKKKERDASRGSLFGKFFSIKKDGETRRVRFNCRDNEPALKEIHYNARNKKRSIHSEENCVGCYYRGRGHKYIGDANPQAVFNLIDKSTFHVRELDTKNKDGSNKREFSLCTEDATCKGCRLKLPVERGGQREWEMAMGHAATLDSCNRNLGKRCKSCDGQGKIKVVEFRCSECMETIEYTPPEEDGEEEFVTCGHCNEACEPMEILECSNGCESPERGSILDTDIDVTRNGLDKKTSYTFEAVIPFVPMEDWMLECEPADLSERVKPMSPETQAKVLGVGNPFASGGRGIEDEGEGEETEGGSESYDESSEETTEAIDDSDEIPF